MFVGEAPGEEESKRGMPFVGKAGEELDYWLGRTCRLDREEVFVTNMMRERPPNNRDPKPEEIERDLPDLWTEILGVQPEIIVPLGLISTRYFLGEWASMELCHGLPHRVKVMYTPVENGVLTFKGSWEGTVLPIVHPAAGLHQSGYYALTVWGFERLARYLKDEIGIHEIDDLPVAYSHGLLPAGETVIAIDTEGSPEHPWCLTWSGAARQASLIRASQHYELGLFRDWIRAGCADLVILHNAPHDLRVLDAMGISLDGIRVIDTMQLAYTVGRLPQGLKALAYRLCRMRMRDYEDMVGPTNERLAMEYLKRVEAVFAPAHPKEKKHPVWKAVQRCWKAKGGPRDLWGKQQPEIHRAAALRVREIQQRLLDDVIQPDAALDVLEGMPVATLDDVPFEEVLPYACADADATRRVFFKLREYFD